MQIIDHLGTALEEDILQLLIMINNNHIILAFLSDVHIYVSLIYGD